MPSRQLKSGIITSLRFNRVSWCAQNLYLRLIDLVDDYARFDAHPLIVARAAFPYGDPNGRIIPDAKIEAWLAELEQSHVTNGDLPLLTRYEVNGVRYLVLHRWTERVRAEKSRCPDPPWNQLLTFAGKNVEEAYRRWQLSANVGSRQQMLAAASKVGNVWNCPTNVGSRQQMLAAASEPNRTEPNPNPVPYGEEGKPSLAEVKASRTRFGALRAQVERLEAGGDSLTEAERLDLRKKRRELAILQKNQAAGDLTAGGP